MSNRRAIALLVVVIAAAYADILFFGRGFYQADVVSYYYPMKHTVRELVAHGELPYWNRYVSSGQPLAANPAYELWYPPQWLVFLPSFHFGFQLHVVVHFLIAAIAMYALVRSFGASIAASIFGALLFVFSGPYLSQTSKLPLLFGLSWMPLVFLFTREVLREWRWSLFAGAAISAAMQFLIAEPTIVLQTWGLIAAYVIVRARFGGAPAPSPARSKNAAGGGGATLRATLGRVAAIGATATLLAAVQLVPAIDFARDSVRSEPFPWLIVTNWSMPLVRPAEMLFPSLFQQMKTAEGLPLVATMYAYRTESYLQELYIGILAGILVLAGVLTRQRGALAFLALFALSFIAAAGEHTPLWRLLYDSGLARTIRYPEKFIIVGAFAAMVWAALLFDRLRDDRRLARAAMFITVAVAVAALTGLGSERNYFAIQLARAAVVIAFIGPLRTRLPKTAWMSALIALTTVDLAASMYKPAARMPRSFFDAPPIVASLPGTREGRLFHEAAWDLWDQRPGAMSWARNRTVPDFARLAWSSVFPNLPVLHGRQITLEEDIDRTSLKNTEALRETLKSVRREGWIARELQLLRLSNVRSRIRFLPFEERSFNAVGVEEVDGHPRYAFASGVEGDLYKALDRGDHVAIVDGAFPVAPGEVTSIHETGNTIRLTTRNPRRALLLITVTAHKYWRATIDGRAAPLIPANVAYQALDIPPGAHTIELRYRNPLVIPSAIVSLVTLLILAAIAIITDRHRAAG